MIKEAGGGTIKTEFHQGITTIEFAHPQSNSMPGALLEALTQAIYFAGNDKECRVIVLRSGGDGAFCAGASFDELSVIETKEQGHAFFMGFANLINAMRRVDKFIVARIHGKCVGGGVGIAAAADYAIALETAEVKLSELAVGIGPFVVGPAVQRKIGLSAFSQLAIDASMWRNAIWARKKGLYAEVHPSVASMDESIVRLANSLSHSSPEAMKSLKRALWEDAEHWDKLLETRASLSGNLVLSKFSKDAIAAFKKKS